MRRFLRTLAGMIAEIPPVKRFYEGMGVILALHQVRELQHDWHDPSTEGFAGEAGLKRCFENPAWRNIRPDALRTSPTSLERLITDMQSTGYRFISMNDLYHALIKGHTGEKLVCIIPKLWICFPFYASPVVSIKY